MRVLKLLDRYFEEVAAGVLLCIVMGLLQVQIALRFLFDTGVPWSEEVVRLTFVWFVYLGAALGVQREAHIRIVSFLHLVPSIAVRRVVVLVADLCWLAFNLAVVWISLEMLRRFGQFPQRTPVLGISIVWIYGVIPVCFALMSLRLVQLYLRFGWSAADQVWANEPRETARCG